MADRIILEAGGVLIAEDGFATDALAQEDGASFFWEDGWRALLESVLDPAGAVAVVLAPDVLVGAGTLSLPIQLADDTLVASGTAGTSTTGTLTVTLAEDVLAGTGAASPAVTGTVSVQLAEDVLVAQQSTLITGRVILEGGGALLSEDGIATDALADEDSGSFYWEDGSRALLESVVENTAGLAVTLADDTLVAFGNLAAITGTVAATTETDDLNAHGTSIGVLGPIAGTLEDDVLVGSGTFAALVSGSANIHLEDDDSTGTFGPGSAPAGRRGRSLTGYGLGYTLRKQPLSNSLN